MSRIKQAVAKVVYFNRTAHWIRISRRSLDSLAEYYRKNSDFRYLKIYEIVNYNRHHTARGIKHKIGHQIGFVTRNGAKLY